MYNSNFKNGDRVLAVKGTCLLDEGREYDVVMDDYGRPTVAASDPDEDPYFLSYGDDYFELVHRVFEIGDQVEVSYPVWEGLGVVEKVHRNDNDYSVRKLDGGFVDAVGYFNRSYLRLVKTALEATTDEDLASEIRKNQTRFIELGRELNKRGYVLADADDGEEMDFNNVITKIDITKEIVARVEL